MLTGLNKTLPTKTSAMDRLMQRASKDAVMAKAHATVPNEAANLLAQTTANSDLPVGNFVDSIVATQYRPRVFYPRRLYGHNERQNGLE